MQISKREIEAVKRSHDLMTVVSSYGIRLQRKGSNYVGLCPFHKEKTPSFTVNPKTNLYHCFGCNAGGDVIGFVTKQEGIGFREAFEKLSKNGSRQRSAISKKNNGKSITPLPSASPLSLRGDRENRGHIPYFLT
ncbi:MAG: CHC2 zinc finger domain-containing protein [Nitrospirota bacterium]